MAIETCPEHSGLVVEIKNLNNSVLEIKDIVQLLSDKLNRPTWITTTIISVLSSIISILSTFILYSHFGAA